MGKVYTGPAIAAWRRLALRYARSSVLALLVAGLGMLLAFMVSGWRPRPLITNGLFGAFAVLLAAWAWTFYERQRLVREAPLPQFLKRKLRDTYPHLTARDTELVERGLRQFFLACLRSRGRFVAMPSRVVDSMWHEFILHTRAYREWCDLVLGRFMDHVPAEALGRKAISNDGLRRAWYWACRDESITPRKPSRLPLLFALDAKLAIANGFHYVPDCTGLAHTGVQGAAGQAYCGESFSDGSYSGDADGFGGQDGQGSAGDSDGSSSDGCGGGCGGGGD